MNDTDSFLCRALVPLVKLLSPIYTTPPTHGCHTAAASKGAPRELGAYFPNTFRSHVALVVVATLVAFSVVVVVVVNQPPPLPPAWSHLRVRDTHTQTQT